MISRELSVEPSFTHMISMSSNDCVKADSRDFARYCSALYTGTMMEYLGIVFSVFAGLIGFLFRQALADAVNAAAVGLARHSVVRLVR